MAKITGQLAARFLFLFRLESPARTRTADLVHATVPNTRLREKKKKRTHRPRRTDLRDLVPFPSPRTNRFGEIDQRLRYTHLFKLYRNPPLDREHSYSFPSMFSSEEKLPTEYERNTKDNCVHFRKFVQRFRVISTRRRLDNTGIHRTRQPRLSHSYNR